MNTSKPLLPIAVQISPWAAVTALILLVWSDYLFGSLIAVVATALLLASLVFHELGHIVAASIGKVPVSAIGFCAAGTYIRRQQARLPAIEMVISLAGPVASL